MPNKSRNIYAGNYYHIYNRAVEKRTIFYSESDYEYFISKAILYKEMTEVKILAYCILPNHFHFLLKEPKSTSKVEISAISKFISLLSNSYTKHFNLTKEHSGRLFQGPFKSKLVDDDSYLKVLLNYINLNHLKHKITDKVNDWPYSSHHNYVGTWKYNLIGKDCIVDFEEYKQVINYYKNSLSSLYEEF